MTFLNIDGWSVNTEKTCSNCDDGDEIWIENKSNVTRTEERKSEEKENSWIETIKNVNDFW